MSSIKGKRIALIGGAGFIGHNLALKLKELEAEVSVVDSLQVNNLLTFTSDNAPYRNEIYLDMLNERIRLLREKRIPLLIQDVRDYHAVSKLLKEIRPEIIVHLAAVAHANQSNKDPYSTFDHSLRTLENTLDNARAHGSHVIYLSSSMIYGNFTRGIVDEETPCDPLGIYGALKFSGERLVIGYNQVFDLPYTIIRPSALYGQRCVSRRVGQIFIENAISKKPLIVQGNGEERLDFTYISDFIDGIIRVMISENARNQTFNLTYGESRSISQMIGILKDYFPDIEVDYQPKDRLMPARGTLSVDKAKERIGYSPHYPLEKGFREYIQWYLDQYPQMNELTDRLVRSRRIS